MDTYTSEDARREWRRILDRVQRGEQVGITRYGDPLAVVVPADWYEKAKDRPDLSRFEVHHLDGDPRNNDPSNLELRERPS